MGASDMAQKIKVLAVKPEDLNSIPSTSSGRREPIPVNSPLISTQAQ